MEPKVVIIGAGLAGLTCALRLRERGIQSTIYEASGRVGGRVGTDQKDGFQLDRGFQVMLTAYPASARILDYPALRLASFHSGARIFKNRRLITLGDPTRHLADLFPTALASIGNLADKARVLRLRTRVTRPTLERLLAHPEITTEQYLRNDGFSSAIIDQFFRPFLGGIFLERQLKTSSRKFEFVFRMFSKGEASLPATGMQAIPDQLANRLHPGQIHLNQPVLSIEPRAVLFEDGKRVRGSHIVLATDSWSTQRLLGLRETVAEPVACLYFAARRAPLKGPWLILNGEKAGPINNLCVPSQVQPSYAPSGQSLVSVTVVDPVAAADPNLGTAVREQLETWFGFQTRTWRHLRTYRIARPIPPQPPPALQDLTKPAKLAEGLYRCGDSEWISSIEGAIRSGLRAADEIEF